MAILATGLLFLPWAIWSLVLTPHPSVALDWIRPFWVMTPPVLAIPWSLEVFGLGGQAGLPGAGMKQFRVIVFPAALRLLGIAVLILLALWVVVPWGDRQLGIRGLGRRKAWLCLQLFLPLGALWLVSFYYRPVYHVGRYDLVAYPAYPLLLGLAFRKLLRVRGLGPLFAVFVALLLLIPIGTKLFLYYYQAPPVGTARATAKVLHTQVDDGDVVVFTGTRGLPVLYYLEQLGYRWDKGECRAMLTGRWFGCRMYPRETERSPANPDPRRVLSSAVAVRDDVQEFMRPIRGTGASLWVAFHAIVVSQQSVTVANPADALLLREFQRRNLKFRSAEGATGVFRSQQDWTGDHSVRKPS